MRRLHDNLHLLDCTRAATLRMVCELPQHDMDWSPAPRQWSVGEILDHLIKSGELYRNEMVALVDLARRGKDAYIRKTVQEIDFAPAFLPKQLLPLVDVPFTVMTLFVPPFMRDMMIRSAAVMKGQSPEIARPRKGRLAAQLICELQASLDNTVNLLRENPDLPYDQMRLQHPMLGVNNVPQLLRLTALHERRHQDQMRRILSQLRTPTRAA
jgi:hypothetical protein